MTLKEARKLGREMFRHSHRCGYICYQRGDTGFYPLDHRNGYEVMFLEDDGRITLLSHSEYARRFKQEFVRRQKQRGKRS